MLLTFATFRPTAAPMLAVALSLVLVPIALAVALAALVALTVTAPPFVITAMLSPIIALFVPRCQLTPTAAATPTPLPPVPLVPVPVSADALVALLFPLSALSLALGRSDRPDCAPASASALLPSSLLPDALAKTTALLVKVEEEATVT